MPESDSPWMAKWQALIGRLRAFCDCSAFAFHRARNKLRINNQGKIY